jgi:hypothetical protein
MAKVFVMALHRSGSKSMAETLGVPGIQSPNTAKQTYFALVPGEAAVPGVRVADQTIDPATLRPLGGSA